MGDIRQTNFRVDTESANAFRAFCEENGYNQAQGFDHLIQVLELNKAKTCIEGRLTEITTFEEYIKKIMDSYLTSLQIAQNTEERVREDYKTDIALRDKALADNEQKIIKRDEKINQLTSEIQNNQKIAKEAVQSAENAKKQAESASQIASEKEKINSMLSSKLAEAEEKLSGYDKLKSEEESLKKNISDLQHSNELAKAETNHLKEQYDNTVKQLQETTDALSAASEKVNELTGQITSLKRDLTEQAKVLKQEQELAVERAVTQAEKKMQEQIVALIEEKARLKMQIEILSEK